MLTLMREDAGTLRLHFEAPQSQFFVDSSTLADYSLLRWEGMTVGTGHVGAPDLPTLSTLVRLPKGSTVRVESEEWKVKSGEWRVGNGKPIVPVTEGWVKDMPRPEYHPDEKTYATDAYYRGGDIVGVEDLGVMGDCQLFRLTVRPVAYNPVSGALTVCSRIDATLKVESGQWSVASGERFLIVSRTEFRDGLQPFVQWKRQEGYDVEELYVETNLRDSIKAQIQPFFDHATLTEPAPKYMLLVGDAGQIQSFIGMTAINEESHTTDLYYAEFTEDYLPECMLGRWPVNDTAELRVVVEKTLRYEQFRDMDTAELRRILLVAGEEATNPAPTTTNGQVNYLKGELKLAHPEADTLCYYNPSSGMQRVDIMNDLRQGASLVNYTAHCTVGGWNSPAVSIGNVEAAGGDQPTVYVNNCCKSNSFAGTGFGEQLLRLPRIGAVGVIGATNSTLWYEDYYWAVGPKVPVTTTPVYDPAALGAFDQLAGRAPTINTLGEMLTAGNMAVTSYGSSYAHFYWEVYCLFGDPALMPYIGIPQPAELSLAGPVVNGQASLTVNGTAGARVTAVQGDRLLGVANIDSSGHATLALRQAIDTMPLILTATGRGLQPHIDTLAVESATAADVTLRQIIVTDSTVECVAENTGTLRLDSLRVALTQTVEEAATGALLEEQTVVIDSLLPGETMALTLPVAVARIGQLPLWQAQLTAQHDSCRCEFSLCRSLAVSYPTLTLHLLNPDSTEARRLLPGRSYLLHGEVTGNYDSLLLEATASPNGTKITTSHVYLPLTTSDSLCSLRIAATLRWQGWTEVAEYHLEAGHRTDGFENGLAAHPWQNDIHAPWTLDGSERHSGEYSLRSGTIGDGQHTDLCVEVFLTRGDTIGFWAKTSSETQHDKFTFFVDGVRRYPEGWGEFGWQQYNHVLTAGRHTLCWRYAKDASHSSGSDCVWIDDVRFPLSLWDSAGDWSCVAATMGIDDSPLSTLRSPLTLYPNPSSGKVWLLSDESQRVSITDMLGRTVAVVTLNADMPTEWDATTLGAGVYFVVGSKGVCSKLIIKQE